MSRDLDTLPTEARYTRVASLADVEAASCEVIHVEGHTIALFSYGDKVYAVDNRCPHMGASRSTGEA